MNICPNFTLWYSMFFYTSRGIKSDSRNFHPMLEKKFTALWSQVRVSFLGKNGFWARNFEVQNLVKKTFFWLKIELFLLVSGLFPRHFQIYLEVLKVFSTILRPTNPRKLTDRWKKDFWARNFKIQNLVNNFFWPKIELF